MKTSFTLFQHPPSGPHRLLRQGGSTNEGLRTYLAYPIHRICISHAVTGAIAV